MTKTIPKKKKCKKAKWLSEEALHIRTNTPKICSFYYRGLECKSRKSRTSVHSLSGTLSIRSSPLNLFSLPLYSHKGLDLIDRVPDELWTEVHDIVQETGIKTIPMEKKYKKAKWLSEEDLQIAVKRREAKSKGEKERYKHLNAEFQRIARSGKKAFLSNQCKEIEENNRRSKIFF